MPEEVRKWLASTFAKQEQVIKITMTMMIKIMIVTKYDHDQSRRGRRNEMSTKYIFYFCKKSNCIILIKMLMKYYLAAKLT